MWDSFGFSRAWVTFLVTLLPLASFPARIIGGVLADKYDKRKIVAVSWTMQIIGAVLLFYARDPISGMIFAIFFGFGFGLGNPPRSALLGELFGPAGLWPAAWPSIYLYSDRRHLCARLRRLHVWTNLERTVTGGRSCCSACSPPFRCICI